MSKFTAKLSAISLLAIVMAFFCSSNAFAIISAPQLLLPNDGVYNQPLSVVLTWETVFKATKYEYQVSTSPTFATLFATNTVNKPIVTATLNNLAKGTTYYWRVRSINGDATPTETSAWSNPTRSFTTGFAAPVLVSPTDNSTIEAYEANLTWNGVAGVTIYKVQVSTSSSFATIFYENQAADLQETVTGLSKGVTYYWRVVGIILHTPDPEEYTETSAVWSFTVSQDILDKVILISPENNSTNVLKSFTCTWNEVSAATGYEIQITKVQGDYSTANIAFAAAPSMESQAVNTLEYGTQYWWHVRATSATKQGPWSDEWNFTMEALPAPGDFNLVTPANNAENVKVNPDFTWTASQNAVTYTIRYSTDNTLATYTEVTDLTNTAYTPTEKLLENTVYYWYVIAVNGTGTKQSETWQFKTEITGSASDVIASYQLNVSPNPADADAQISFNLASAGTVNVTVFDMLGNVVFAANEFKSTGASSISIESSALAAGSYTVKFQFGNESATLPLVIVK